MDAFLRQRVLSDWAGYTVEPDVAPANLQGVLQKSFTSIGLGRRFQEANLTDQWQNLVGPMLAPHCRPTHVSRGVLFVVVDHPAWLHQLTMSHKPNILASVRKQFPHLKIQDVMFRVG